MEKPEVRPEWFAGRLRELRHAAGLTQQQLADATGLNVSFLRDVEQGRRNNPTWQTILALCKALGATPNDFTEEPGAASAPERGRPRKASAEEAPSEEKPAVPEPKKPAAKKGKRKKGGPK